VKIIVLSILWRAIKKIRLVFIELAISHKMSSPVGRLDFRHGKDRSFELNLYKSETHHPYQVMGGLPYI